MKKPLIDLKHPFFEPAWRRVLTFIVCFGWGLFEFYTGAALWGTIFCGVGIIIFYQFFISGDFTEDKPDS